MDFDIAMLTLRLVVGTLFIGHGMQKLAGWFGGPGIDATAGVMEKVGMRPGRFNAIAAGLNEALGGLLLALGLFTPLAAVLIATTMLVAIRTVHFANGVWNQDRGYEYNAVLIAVVLFAVAAGPGSASLDNALGIDLTGLGWAAAALAAAVAGSTAAVLAGRHEGRGVPTSA
jgi:putative oxidoreductase